MVDFHQAIGAERIQARLHYLKQYWARQVEDEKRIRFTASFDPRLSCAALGFDISGEKWVDIFKALRENANIRISGAWIDGEHGKPETWREIVLVSPAIFCKAPQLDRYVTELKRIIYGAQVVVSTRAHHDQVKVLPEACRGPDYWGNLETLIGWRAQANAGSLVGRSVFVIAIATFVIAWVFASLLMLS